MRLLLAEDDPTLGPALRKRLAAEGYAVDLATDGVDAHHLGATEPYDLVVLDLGLPGRAGLDVLRDWRKSGVATPVLILTAREGWRDRVEGLKAGGDDYLGKPFHGEELLARIQALLRRAAGQPTPNLGVGDLRLDEDRQCLVGPDGRESALTGMEFRLLRYFLRHPGQVLSKTRLAEHAYEYDAERDSNVIEVYVRRLREIIGRDHIETRRGQGYVFRP